MSKNENKTFLKKKRKIEHSQEGGEGMKVKSMEIYEDKIPKYNNLKIKKEENIFIKKISNGLGKINPQENKKYKEKVNLYDKYEKILKNEDNLIYIIDYVKAIPSKEYDKYWPKLLNYYFIKISHQNFINEETEKSLLHFKEIVSVVKYNYIIYEMELENNILEYVHYLHIKFLTPFNISASIFNDFSILLGKSIEDINLILYGFYGGHKTVLRIYTYINRNKNSNLPVIKKDIGKINALIKEYNDLYNFDIKQLNKEDINILNIDDLLPEDKFSSDDLFKN